VSSSTSGRRYLVQTTRSASLFLDVLYKYRAQDKYLHHEYVLMRDHFHVLLTVGQGMTIERAVQLIKGGYAFMAGRELGIHAPIWQKGFSEVRSLTWTEYLARVRYIHENPVRAGYVSAPELFEFSSAWPGRQLDVPPQRLKPQGEGMLVGTPAGVP